MGRICDILERKGRKVHALPRHSTVYEALETMVRENIGSLVVTEDGGIAGIFTERDFLRVALEELDLRSTSLDQVMTRRVVCLEPHWTVDESMAVMTHQRIRHLPVLENGRLAGMVSIGDLVKHVSDERGHEVSALTDYIHGKYPG
jgi:IMP dehydrogenase